MLQREVFKVCLLVMWWEMRIRILRISPLFYRRRKVKLSSMYLYQLDSVCHTWHDNLLALQLLIQSHQKHWRKVVGMEIWLNLLIYTYNFASGSWSQLPNQLLQFPFRVSILTQLTKLEAKYSIFKSTNNTDNFLWLWMCLSV